MIELHCEICANAGGAIRISPDTLIARFDPRDVQLPLDGEMFLSAMPERGVPPPWQPGLTWEDMTCPRVPGRSHLPWMGVGDERTLIQMQQNGGPAHLLTNRGTFSVGEDGIEEEEFRHQATDQDLDEEWYKRQSVTTALSQEEYMVELRGRGKTYKEIGEVTGFSKDTVRRKILGITRGKG